MRVAAFLNAICDEHGPLQGVAAETIERMSAADFIELCNDMELSDKLTNANWKEPRHWEVVKPENREAFLIDLGHAIALEYGRKNADRHPVTKELLEA